MTYEQSEKKRQYYIDHKERILKNAKERYLKRHPVRKCARYYEIITPDNKVIRKSNFEEVSDFFGYSEPTMRKMYRNNTLFGYQIIKVI